MTNTLPTLAMHAAPARIAIGRRVRLAQAGVRIAALAGWADIVAGAGAVNALVITRVADAAAGATRGINVDAADARAVAAPVRATRRIAGAHDAVAALPGQATAIVTGARTIRLADLPPRAALLAQEGRIGLAVAGDRITNLADWTGAAFAWATIDDFAAIVEDLAARAKADVGRRLRLAGLAALLELPRFGGQ